jgi:hypothetical protein
VENKNIVVAVFLDFKRAFETIDRRVLIQKLQNIYGIGETVLNWFSSYLTNRRQKVKYEDVASDSLLVEHGVPQGTVLGPLLFNLYVNDIIKYVNHCNISLFADDTMLYKSGKDVYTIINQINDDLRNIHSYLCNNSLSININKSKYIIFQSRYSHTEFNNIQIEINNLLLERVTEMKYLGVIFDEKLTFLNNSMYSYILNKMSQRVYFLNRIGSNLNTYTRRLLYIALFSPYSNYCSSILFMLPAYKIHDIIDIQCIQSRAMRTILGCNRYTPIALMLNVLNLMTARQTIMYNTLLIIFKIKLYLSICIVKLSLLVNAKIIT